METFIKVFLVLQFSLPNELQKINRNSFQVNYLSFSSCLMLKKSRIRVISIKKKISHKNHLKLSHSNRSWKPSFTMFSFFLNPLSASVALIQKPVNWDWDLYEGNPALDGLKETGTILIYAYPFPPKKVQQFHKSTLHFPGYPDN